MLTPEFSVVLISFFHPQTRCLYAKEHFYRFISEWPTPSLLKFLIPFLLPNASQQSVSLCVCPSVRYKLEFKFCVRNSAAKYKRNIQVPMPCYWAELENLATLCSSEELGNIVPFWRTHICSFISTAQTRQCLCVLCLQRNDIRFKRPGSHTICYKAWGIFPLPLRNTSHSHNARNWTHS